LGGCGIPSNSLAFGGNTGASIAVYSNEIFSDGTEIVTINAHGINDSTSIIIPFWVTTSSLNTARYYLAGCGTTSDALSFGGGTGSSCGTTEKWNGEAWATTTSLIVTRQYVAGFGSGSADAIALGGTHSGIGSTTVERWNGSS